ncbi:MAG: aminoacyl-tRNA hydrolase [Armatimonadetes bacterium]|nr:aminoacyl-tRNA hydrolase [Armatimonadota bacterium]
MFRRRAKEPQVLPTWLVVGLGNPGPQYSRTRHNVGFDCIDMLAETHRCKLDQRRFQGVYGLAEIGSTGVILLKPMTFMNLSGQAVASVAKHYNIPMEQIVVIADDLDLEVGRVRMKPRGGAGGHNGHRSIIASLNGDRYPRIKIGIDKGPGIDHVLGRFTPDERVQIDEAISKAAKGTEVLVSQGLERALTFVNS